MLTSAERRRSPVLVIALTLSLLVHVVGVLLYAGFAHKWIVAVAKAAARKAPDELVATSDRITLERRVVPRASVPSRAAPPAHTIVQEPSPPKAVQAPPRPTPEPTAAPTPVVRREIAHIIPRATAQPSPVATHATSEERKIAYAPPQRNTVPNARAPRASLTAADIAALTQQFKQTIARAQADEQIARPPRRAPSTMKRYDFDMSGRLADLTSAQGQVEVLQSWSDRAHKMNVYYIHVRMVYSDGTSETVDIPWPVAFSIGRDPLAAANHPVFHHIPDPPPGYVLPHPFQLSRLLCIYYRNECQAVIDAEQKNGGLPAGAPAPAN